MIFEEFRKKLEEVITVKLLVAITVGSITSYQIYDSQSKKNDRSPKVAESDINEHQNLNNSPNKRSPSSVFSINHKVSPIYKPVAKLTSKDESNFVEPDTSASGEVRSVLEDNSPSHQDLFSNAPIFYPLATQETKMKKAREVALDELISGGPDIKKVDDKKKYAKKASITTTSHPVIIIPSSVPSENSCSTNIVGGSFGNPIGITLVCIYPSTIKYRLSASGSCFDPESDGITYASQIVIGPKNGNYCLSYIGNSETGGSSIVYQQNYIINSALPNLSVGHSKIFYQTTELIGTSFISSQDFGKSNFSVGQINLKAHDPGPDNLNYSCDEIITNYVTLPSPAPIEVLSLFDVSLASVSSQVEIPLRLDQLVYGDNFITSYIENNNFVVPLYSCSTTKINLDDFEYFQADVSQSITGDNSVREFEGEFSSYGFFEDEAVIFRGPAGVKTIEQTGENLKSGMYGMFY